MEGLIKLYTECKLTGIDKLNYINSNGYNFKSVDLLRTKIKVLRKEEGVSPGNGQKYETTNNNQIKELKQKIKESSNISHTIKIEKERDVIKKDKEISDKKYKFLLSENQILQNQLDIADRLSKNKDKININITSGSKSESTPVICFSDYHYEETVHDFSINGLNEYNVEIAKKRGSNFFKNSLKLINMFGRDTNIKNIVLWLGGDLISGYLHEELEEENGLSPMEALLGVKAVIKGGIDFLLENSDYNLVIPCSYGNHGRYHKKPRHGSGYKNNYEYLLYNIIAGEYENNDRVKFQISKSYFTYLNIYNQTVAFSHGDNAKYGGGIGGITIPLNKAISQWRKSNPTDIFVMGHFHQVMFHKDFIVNGSVIGYNAFAQSIKAEYEKPCQAGFMLNSKYGRTIDFRIYLE